MHTDEKSLIFTGTALQWRLQGDAFDDEREELLVGILFRIEQSPSGMRYLVIDRADLRMPRSVEVVVDGACLIGKNTKLELPELTGMFRIDRYDQPVILFEVDELFLNCAFLTFHYLPQMLGGTTVVFPTVLAGVNEDL